MGLSFVDLLTLLQGEPTSVPVTQLFYSTEYFWLILLLTTPIITMRLFALEKFSGTFETLMTAPVSDLQVVLAKFTAAMIFYMFMWLPSLGSILVLRHYINHPDAFDGGLIGSTFLGIFLLGRAVHVTRLLCLRLDAQSGSSPPWSVLRWASPCSC